MAKVLVTLDDRLLRKIDAEARRLGVSRSALIGRLAEERMARGTLHRGRAKEAIEGIREIAARNPWPEDATEAIRAERDARAGRLE